MGDSLIRPYLQIMRLDRPIGSLLLLWPTLWALWLAGGGSPDPVIVLIFVTGTLVMRSAGCVINDWADRDIDGKVARTRNRPLAAGTLSSRQALRLFLALLGIALLLALQLNALAIKVSLFAAIIAVVYPFTKRFTDAPQLFLGIAFSMGIPMAFAALTNSVPVEAWIMFAANFMWIVAYDTQYAMSDRPDDIKAGIRSTAILFGPYDNLIVGGLQVLFVGIMVLLGMRLGMTTPYYLGLIVASGFLVYQQWLCRDREPAKCLRAFFNNNWVGAMIYCGLFVALVL